jgi:hypothetical protein
MWLIHLAHFFLWRDRIIHYLLPNNNKVLFGVLSERFFFPTLQLHNTYLSHPKFEYNYSFASSFDILCLFKFSILILEVVKHDGMHLNMIKSCDETICHDV